LVNKKNCFSNKNGFVGELNSTGPGKSEIFLVGFGNLQGSIFFKMGPIFILITTLCMAPNIKAQENGQELFEEVVNNNDLFLQHQTAFCQLWLEASVERQSLNHLCFRLAKKYSGKVILFCL
jgi:hypothetical protein